MIFLLDNLVLSRYLTEYRTEIDPGLKIEKSLGDLPVSLDEGSTLQRFRVRLTIGNFYGETGEDIEAIVGMIQRWARHKAPLTMTANEIAVDVSIQNLTVDWAKRTHQIKLSRINLDLVESRSTLTVGDDQTDPGSIPSDAIIRR